MLCFEFFGFLDQFSLEGPSNLTQGPQTKTMVCQDGVLSKEASGNPMKLWMM